MSKPEIEYRCSEFGVKMYLVHSETKEQLVDSWDVLNGLTKCTSRDLDERESYAQTLAITWAVYVMKHVSADFE